MYLAMAYGLGVCTVLMVWRCCGSAGKTGATRSKRSGRPKLYVQANRRPTLRAPEKTALSIWQPSGGQQD